MSFKWQVFACTEAVEHSAAIMKHWFSVAENTNPRMLKIVFDEYADSEYQTIFLSILPVEVKEILLDYIEILKISDNNKINSTKWL